MKKFRVANIVLLILLLFSTGCFKDKKHPMSDVDIMAKNFRQLIIDINAQQNNRAVSKSLSAGESTVSISDGVYVDEKKLTLYSYEYLGTLSVEEINQIASKLFSAQRSNNRAMLVLSNRGLPYFAMLSYKGVGDFTGDSSKAASAFLSPLEVLWDVANQKYVTATGEVITNRLMSFGFGIEGERLYKIEHDAKVEGENSIGEVSIYLPLDTPVTDLKAAFEVDKEAVVKIGDTVQISGETVNDFTNTIRYAVTGSNASTKYYDIHIYFEEDLSNKPVGEKHPNSGPYSVVEGDWASATFPLGSYYEGLDGTFAVYSKNAERVLLEIYGDFVREDAQYDYWMQKGSDNIWRIKVKDLPDHAYYGFRVWGSNWKWDENWTRNNSSAGFIADVDPDFGHRFNPNKVLFDPYGREMSHDKESLYMHEDGENGGMFGTGGGSSNQYSGPVLTKGVSVDRRNIDTGRYAPKSILFKDDTVNVTTLSIPPQDAITMEAHLRGLTMDDSSTDLGSIVKDIDGFQDVVGVPDAYRGTYKGAAYMAPYLKALGYNTIEFLPVHETDNDSNEYLQGNLDGSGTKPNFWGYMTLSYFSPDRRYSYDKSPGGPTKEFKEMVKAFNDAGIAVMLDVVYNHSGEGGNWGSNDVTGFVSMGGFDTSEYYQLTPDHTLVDGATGCGNQLNYSKEAARKLVEDSITYWTEEMGVDGFRFDLAPVLGRYPDNHAKDDWDAQRTFYSDHGLLTWLKNYGSSQGVKMVAEAWDIWGYQVSNFPNGWEEWNGRYRDVVRNFMRGVTQTNDYPSFASVMNGDWDHFGSKGKNPYDTVNFLVAHDGFTLADLVSYGDKSNSSSWPFGPTDGGSSDNNSWDSDGSQDLRRQRIRNFWVTQFFSRGLPMTVYGDEFGRTQNGNNNPYSLDSIATWNNYNMINTDAPHTVSTGDSGSYHNNLGTDGKSDSINNIFLFAKEIIHTRKNHESLRRTSYDSDYVFKKSDGSSNLSNTDRAVWLRIKSSSDTDFLLFINMWTENVNFTIPAASTGKEWVRRIDTAAWAEEHNNFWTEDQAEIFTNVYGVNPWSVAVFQEVDSGDIATPAISGNDWGVYTESQTITINTTTPDAAIYYTLDGSNPLDETNENRKEYTAPFEINKLGPAGDGFGGYDIKAGAVLGRSTSAVAEKRFTISEKVTPSTYGSNVILQGFNWDSHEINLYNTIKDNGTLIGENFDWVWFPPASNAGSDEGYLPRALSDLNSNYGTKDELIAAIQAIKPAKAIADIVINHRVGMTGWGDFDTPQFGDGNPADKIYKSITRNDEGFTSDSSDMKGASLDVRGWPDTGDSYSAARDIDHTNIYVQKDIIDWMKETLMGTAGFAGFRYDYVKGYSGQYTGYYSAKTNAGISIGELWQDGAPQDGLNDWVNETEKGGYRSLVFDFSLKNTLNNAFGWYDSKRTYDNWNMSILKRGDGDKPEGYIGWHPENSVTFVDNHDTGSSQQHWKLKDDHVYLAYVYILTHPGVPSVAWDHFFDTNAGNVYGKYNDVQINNMQEHIKTLIDIRKKNGITQTSSAVVERAELNEYAVKIDNKIAVRIGDGESYSPGHSDEWSVIYSGTNFSVWKRTPSANLSAIELSTGSITFDKDTLEYSLTVGSSVESITVTPTKVSQEAQWTIKKDGVVTGSDITLTNGLNVITIEVTAGDKTKTYTLNITRELADTTLASLELLKDGSDKLTGFEANTVDYTLDVANTSTLTLTAQANNSQAIIKVDGVAFTGSKEISLNKGLNTINILVENGSVSRTYQLNITRKSITTLMTKYDTQPGEDITFGYRIFKDGVEVQEWTEVRGNYSTGNYNSNDYNWICEIDYSGEYTSIEWKAHLGSNWMGGSDRVATPEKSNFSAW